MNILTEGKDCYQKTKVNTMQRTSSVALFHGKSLKFIGYLGILGLLAGASLSTAAARERDLLDAGWTFQIGDPVDVTTAVTSYPEIGDLTKLQDPTAEVTLEASRPDPVATHAGENVSYVQTNYNDSAWRQLNLPHDWVVEQPFDSNMAQNHGYKAGFNNATSTNTIAWYRHTFTLPAGDTNKTMWLEFDGIYRNALIWLNGRCIGRDVSGYAPISFDVTSNMIAGGTNVLVVRVDASRFEGWFYEGAGIYRHVWLEKTAPVHVGHWGTYVATTSLVGSNATITVQTAVTNQSSSATVNGTLTSTLLDANSNAVTAVTSNLNLVATDTVSLQSDFHRQQCHRPSGRLSDSLRRAHGAIRLHQRCLHQRAACGDSGPVQPPGPRGGGFGAAGPAAILPDREIEGDGVQRLSHLAQHADGGTA
jgi:hypothetical protein